MSKNFVLERDEHDILFEVTYQLLEETFDPIVQHINSSEFKEELKTRLEENGVKIEFNDLNPTQTFTLADSSVIEIPKYNIVIDDTIERIKNDIHILELVK